MRLIAALALLTAVLLAPSASATAPVATASKGCSIGDSRGYGTTYVIKISVSGDVLPGGPQPDPRLPRLPPRQVGEVPAA